MLSQLVNAAWDIIYEINYTDHVVLHIFKEIFIFYKSIAMIFGYEVAQCTCTQRPGWTQRDAGWVDQEVGRLLAVEGFKDIDHLDQRSILDWQE